jgi:hypothetical protein
MTFSVSRASAGVQVDSQKAIWWPSSQWTPRIRVAARPTSMSMRLNSSKQAHAPHCASPAKNLPCGAGTGRHTLVHRGCGIVQSTQSEGQGGDCLTAKPNHQRAPPGRTGRPRPPCPRPPMHPTTPSRGAPRHELVVEVVSAVEDDAVGAERLGQVLGGLRLAGALMASGGVWGRGEGVKPYTLPKLSTIGAATCWESGAWGVPPAHIPGGTISSRAHPRGPPARRRA